MSLNSYYKNVFHYRVSAGGFDSVGSDELVREFDGIIQAPSNSNSFVNGKDTSSTSGILFCSVDDASALQEGDKVSYGGAKYIVGGIGSQEFGVTGILSHHAQFSLSFDNDG